MALLFLVAVNTASCLYQGARLRQDMRVLTDYLKDLKGHQAPAALMVADVAHAMRALKWWLPSDVVFFLYNGRGAL